MWAPRKRFWAGKDRVGNPVPALLRMGWEETEASLKGEERRSERSKVGVEGDQEADSQGPGMGSGDVGGESTVVMPRPWAGG